MLGRIRKKPRHTQGTTTLFGQPFEFVDSASFLFIYDELFNKRAYEFRSQSTEPRIIDGGANVGLSLVYFKKLYPQSHILALEADPMIFDVLQANVKSLGLSNVIVRNQALWDRNGTVSFASDHADGGRVEHTAKSITVESVALAELLNGPVDFLKLDIEGAELRVLKAARESLRQVEKVFVEYHSHADQPQELADLLDVLKQAGFRYYITSPSMFTKRPLIRRESYGGMDMVLNIYGVRDTNSVHD